MPAVLRLDYENLEIIVVDNGSRDGSVEYLKSLSRVTIVANAENLGYGVGKNLGVSAARGEYVLFLDNDILIENVGILKALLGLMDDDTGFVQVPLLDTGMDKTKYYGISFGMYGANAHMRPVHIDRILGYKEKTIEIGAATGASWFFRRSVWNDLGGLDESQPFNIDDIDIGPRAWIYGYKNLLYTKDRFIHLGINKTITARAYAQRFRYVFSGHARSILKNYTLMGVVRVFPIFLTYSFLKALKFMVLKHNSVVLLSFLSSVAFFVRNISDTLQHRRWIQSKRRSREDMFLKVKPPSFS